MGEQQQKNSSTAVCLWGGVTVSVYRGRSLTAAVSSLHLNESSAREKWPQEKIKKGSWKRRQRGVEDYSSPWGPPGVNRDPFLDFSSSAIVRARCQHQQSVQRFLAKFPPDKENPVDCISYSAEAKVWSFHVLGATWMLRYLLFKIHKRVIVITPT